MENLSEMKINLNEIIPEVITVYLNELNSNCAIIDQLIGLITINIKSLENLKILI